MPDATSLIVFMTATLALNLAVAPDLNRLASDRTCLICAKDRWRSIFGIQLGK